MYKLPIDQQSIGFIPDASCPELSKELIDEIERLLEGKMINGQRRNHRYGSKVFGSFGPFERNPLPPVFQSFLDQLIAKHPGVINFDPTATSTTTSDSQAVYNQVEILKLSPGTKYFFDLDKEQETSHSQLFINLQGTVPIALYNNTSHTPIHTTITPDLSAIISQPKDKDQQPSTSPEDQASSPPNSTEMTVASQSILLTPLANCCILFNQDIVRNYTRQIKAASYKTKPMHLPSISTSLPQSPPHLLKNLVYDYSLLNYMAKLKHLEKKQKRVEWLHQQQAEGQLTQDELIEQLRRDRLKDVSLEAEFEEEGIQDDASAPTSTPTFQPTPEQIQAREYLLSIPTFVYKRVNSYAIIFRSFQQFTPLTDTNLTSQDPNESPETAPELSKKLNIAEKQTKQLAEKQARQAKAVPTLAVNLEEMTQSQLAEFEKKHVHSVYDNIADHFSGTRYQAWPQVDEFVQQLPKDTLLADIGCGNGKYLVTNPDILTVGCDISFNLLKLASQRGCNVAVGDGLAVPFRSDYFDNSISIAVLHHIASKSRRVECINEMLRITRPGGQILITVWAKEQDGSGGRVFNQGDVWVPFNTTKNVEQELQRQKEKRDKELAEHHRVKRRALIDDEAIQVTISKPEDARAETPQESSTTDLQTTPSATSTLPDVQLPENVSEASTRFYHVFAQGEIEDHVNDPAIKYPLRIDKVFYGKGNWCIIFSRL